jgi:hypothetical protein
VLHNLDLDVQQTHRNLCILGIGSTPKCDPVIAMIVKNLATPKAGDERDLLFNEPVSEMGLLNKSSCSAAA